MASSSFQKPRVSPDTRLDPLPTGHGFALNHPRPPIPLPLSGGVGAQGLPSDGDSVGQRREPTETSSESTHSKLAG